MNRQVLLPRRRIAYGCRPCATGPSTLQQVSRFAFGLDKDRDRCLQPLYGLQFYQGYLEMSRQLAGKRCRAY